MSSRTLLLVDAMAVIYRAFYAIRNLSTSAGAPTNALFGFVRMFRQLEDWWAPTHWAVVFDGGLPDDRMAILPEYKAQRAPMPDDLRAQLPLIEEFLDCYGAPRIRIPCEEADDVMAGMAQAAEAQGAEVLLATADKDLYQLVGEHVKLVSMSGKQESMGPAEVEAKTGVRPAQIVEWLALVGDHADNIAGVPGVGPKTAARLLSTHGSLDNIWANLEAIGSERLQAALGENRGCVERNLQMVRLRTRVAGIEEWDAYRKGRPDIGKLIAFFEKVEFGSLAEELRQPDLFG